MPDLEFVILTIHFTVSLLWQAIDKSGPDKTEHFCFANWHRFFPWCLWEGFASYVKVYRGAVEKVEKRK